MNGRLSFLVSHSFAKSARMNGAWGIAGWTSVGEDGFVGEDAVEGGAADAELSGGAEFVSVVDFEDGLDVMADDGIEGEAIDFEGGLKAGRGVEAIEDGDVGGTDDAVGGFEE